MFLEILLFLFVGSICIFLICALLVFIDLLFFSNDIKRLKKKGLITTHCVLPKNPFKLFQLKKSILDFKFADEVNFYYFKLLQRLENEKDVK